MSDTPHDADRTAEILLTARRTLTPIPHLPEALRPRTLDEAYAVQDRMAAALGHIAGWKVGASKPGTTPFFAPMPASGGFFTSGSHVAADGRRMRGVEAEIAFLIGRDLPPRATPYSREEVTAAIASAHPVIELLESAYVDPFAVFAADRPSMMADLQITGGFAYGAAHAGWQDRDLAGESVTVKIDGEKRFEGTASNPAGTDLLGLVTWLANDGSARTGGLKAGQWITTGSWSGWTPAHAGAKAEVRFSNFGVVELTFA